jgi:hypothetical protein
MDGRFLLDSAALRIPLRASNVAKHHVYAFYDDAVPLQIDL